MIRADMIGPRRLVSAERPSAFLGGIVMEKSPLQAEVGPVSTQGMVNGVITGLRPPSPPQPALVIRDDLTKGMDLFKAVRAHADYLHKAAIDVSEGAHPEGPDVSSPEHKHARLQAMKVHLTEKLNGHQASGHDATHPDVQRRINLLADTNRKIQHLEGLGITSGPDHHYDMMMHYARNPKSYSEPHVSAALSAHIGVLGGKATQEARAPWKIGTEEGGPTYQVATPMAERQLEQSDRLKGSKKPMSDLLTQARQSQIVDPHGATFARSILEGMMRKSKSDQWVSDKIRLLMHEGKPQDQAIAIAYSMAGRSKKKAKKSLYVTV